MEFVANPFRTTVTGRIYDYIVVALVMAAASALGSVLVSSTGYLAIGVLFLLTVIGLSMWVDRWPVLAAGVLAALIWNFFFIPPVHSFTILRDQDKILYWIDVGVTLAAGQLMATVRQHVRYEKLRLERASLLLRVSQAATSTPVALDGVELALREIDRTFATDSAFWPGDQEGPAIGMGAASASESAVIGWVRQARRPAGRSTTTLPGVSALALPVLSSGSVLGVLNLRFRGPKEKLSPFELESVEACARQLGIILEREQVRLLTEEKRLLEASDRLHRVILDAVSHELKSPLTSLSIIAENFASVDGRDRQSVGHEMRTATRRLQRLVNNLLDQARLESGSLRPKLDWSSPADVVNAAVSQVREQLGSHRLEVVVQPALPPVQMDAALMEHVLSNLLLNAILHTPEGTPISIEVRMGDNRKAVVFEVADRGSGLPPAMRQNLFKKFARDDGGPAGGLGLGLSIVRGFMAAQGGDVTAAPNSGGGARFSAHLPFVAHEELVGEEC